VQDEAMRQRLTQVALALGIVIYVGYGLVAWESDQPLDFYQLWASGRAPQEIPMWSLYEREGQWNAGLIFLREAQLSGSERWKAAAESWGPLAPVATPLLYAGFGATATGDFERDYQRFRVGSILAFCAAVVGLAAALRYPLWGIVLALVLATQSHRVQIDIEVANVTLLQVAALVAFLLLDRLRWTSAHLLAGFVLAIHVAAKPTVLLVPLLLVTHALAARDWRRSGAWTLGALPALWIALEVPGRVLGGAVDWIGWLSANPDFHFTPYFLGGSFVGMLVGGQPAWVHGVMALGSVVVAAAFFWRVPRQGANARAVAATSAIGIFLLTAPFVHGFYPALAVPWVLVLLRPGTAWPLKALAALGAALVSSESLGSGELYYQSLWTYAGVFILLGCSTWDYASQPAARDTTGASLGDACFETKAS
jgi:hypothetical protein